MDACTRTIEGSLCQCGLLFSWDVASQPALSKRSIPIFLQVDDCRITLGNILGKKKSVCRILNLSARCVGVYKIQEYPPHGSKARKRKAIHLHTNDGSVSTETMKSVRNSGCPR